VTHRPPHGFPPLCGLATAGAAAKPEPMKKVYNSFLK
jgi:hypothetical protein